MQLKIIFLTFLLSAIPLLNWWRTFGSVSVYTVGLLLGSLGIVLLIVQYFLGNRQLATKLLGSDLLAINGAHKKLGRYGSLLFLLHLGIMILYHLNIGVNILDFSVLNSYSFGIILGDIAAFIVLTIIVTSIFLKSKLSYRLWKKLHLTAYLVLPLGLIHSVLIGPTVSASSLQRFYWIGLGISCILLIIYRIIFQLTVLKTKYKLLNKKDITEQVVEYTFEPINKKLEPKLGQFIYLQVSKFGENHPFTISGYDEATGRIRISTKKVGRFTNAIANNLAVGAKVYLDGPYGIFTQGIDGSKQIVMIAGGIGITPFMRLIDSGVSNARLFYGNRFLKDAAYLEQLKQAEGQVETINVLSQEKWKGEEGFITVSLLRKYLNGELSDYHFLICGPPVMMKMLTRDLVRAGVDRGNIESELFSL